MDTSKIRSELGWVAQTKFEVGLARTVKWYIGNSQWVERLISVAIDQIV